jgi:ribonuclease BN (tRNA processing enzyme)
MTLQAHFLGSGGALSKNGERLNTSLILSKGQFHIQVDVSGNPFYAAAKVGVEGQHIHHLIVTHNHTDHLGGFLHLLQSRALAFYLAGKSDTPALNIYGPPAAISVLKELFEVFKSTSKGADLLDLHFVDIEKDAGSLDITTAPFDIHCFRVDHADRDTVGISVRDDNGSHLLFSADSRICDAIKTRIGDQTTLIHDCGAGMDGNDYHAGANDLAGLLANHSPKQVILSHLDEPDKQLQSQMIGAIDKVTQIPVIIPNDFDTITV